MPKTKRQIQIGNTEVRAGHRRDCSQLAAVITLTDYVAPHDAAAIEAIEEQIEGQTFVISVSKGVEVEVTFNVGSLKAKDVKEVKA